MIVVRPLNLSNTISVLPRYYNNIIVDDLTIEITNEDTREAINSTITSEIINNGFFSFDIDGDWTENSTYKLKIYNTNSSLVHFRGKIFATQQDEQNYSING